MQPEFLARMKCTDAKRLLAEVKYQVDVFIDEKSPIILLENSDHKTSVPVLYNRINKYEKGYVIDRVGKDGSDVIYRLLMSNRLPRKNLYVTGLFLDLCIKDTIKGLGKISPIPLNVNIIRQCTSYANGTRDEWWHGMKKHNVQLV